MGECSVGQYWSREDSALDLLHAVEGLFVLMSFENMIKIWRCCPSRHWSGCMFLFLSD